MCVILLLIPMGCLAVTFALRLVGWQDGNPGNQVPLFAVLLGILVLSLIAYDRLGCPH